jgi:hypothetical protein
MNLPSTPESSFNHHIKENPYPGRGLVIGRNDPQGNWIILYWIMGRSDSSRNRRFVAEGGTLRTQPIDLGKIKDPSLIIYEAMLELPKVFIVSNGDQTRTIYEGLQKGLSFFEALAGREREPDAPNFTPRISGLLSFAEEEGGKILLSILKANPLDPAYTDRYFYHPALPRPGFGFALTTYAGDGNPLPSFSGDPLLLPLKGTAKEILETYWQALDNQNRVAMAVKEIAPDGSTSRIEIKNQY